MLIAYRMTPAASRAERPIHKHACCVVGRPALPARLADCAALPFETAGGNRPCPATGAAKSENIKLRVFFCTAGRKIILLLSGYDKGRDTSGRRQDREIARARKLMTAHQEARSGPINRVVGELTA
jgi:hypothetical protein